MATMSTQMKRFKISLAWDKAAAWAVILLGLVLRLRQFLTGRSLWLDEAMLALNIVNRDFAALLRPLDYDQGAPIGFLYAQKTSVLIFGNNEFALRLLPLLAGTASLILFYWLLRCLEISPAGQLAALALFAVSPKLVSYSAEAKQYIVDVFVVTLLLLLAVPLFKETNKLKAYLLLGVFGVLTLWFSHPALFVLAGIGVVLSGWALVRREWKDLLTTLGMGLIWLVNLGLLYVISLQNLSQNNTLLDFWETGFMPLPPWLNWNWFGDVFVSAVQYPAGTSLAAGLVVLILTVGWFRIWRKHKQFALAWLAILLFTLLASGLRLYPFLGRMILFIAPLVLLGIGFCIDFIWDRLGAQPTMAWVAVLAISGSLLYQPVTESSAYFIQPKYAEHIRPTLDYLEESWQAGDGLFVSYGAEPAFRYYAARYHLDQIPFETGNVSDYADPPQLLHRLDPLKGKPRVWILLSHVYERGSFNEKDYLLSYLDEIGKEKREFRSPGTSVYLYLYDLNLLGLNAKGQP